MIYVDLRNSDFYDDAQVLIKSFYPRMQTSLLKDDSRLTDEDTVIPGTPPPSLVFSLS